MKTTTLRALTKAKKINDIKEAVRLTKKYVLLAEEQGRNFAGLEFREALRIQGFSGAYKNLTVSKWFDKGTKTYLFKEATEYVTKIWNVRRKNGWQEHYSLPFADILAGVQEFGAEKFEELAKTRLEAYKQLNVALSRGEIMPRDFEAMHIQLFKAILKDEAPAEISSGVGGKFAEIREQFRSRKAAEQQSNLLSAEAA